MGNTLKTVRHFSKSSSTSVEKTDFETCKIFGLVNQKGQPVPLKSIQVTVNILGCLAEVESSLSYQNEEDHPIEAAFTFPVDDGSAVFHFEANIDGRCIVAEIQEKEQAILTYEDAKKHGKTAMLLKEDDKSSDTFQCLLGNLPAHSEARLVMKYVIELAQEYDGKVRFSLPTVLNPRYHPDAGGTIAAEGATYVAPSKVKYQFSMQARVEGYHKVVSVTSERIKLNIQHEQDHKVAKVTLVEDFKFDHDLCFLVEYEKPFTPQVLLEAGNPEAEGLLKEDILMLSFYPDLKKIDISTNGEYIFIVDRSGSMDGLRIKNAREALLLCIKSLPLGCYFNIVSFGSNFSSLFDSGSKKYNKECLEEAQMLLSSMEADMGGTEIFMPLDHVYKQECIEGHPRKIFVLTDGEVGNEMEIIGLVKKHVNTTRLFALGIGDGVSTSLVKGIARAGGGDAEFIADQDRLQPKVISILKKAMQPSISDIDIKLELPPDVTPILIPSELPTFLSPGMRMNVFALLQGIDKNLTATGTVILSGKMDNDKVSYSMEFILSREKEVDQAAPVHRLATKINIKLLQDHEAEINQGILFDISQKQSELAEISKKIVNLSRCGNVISKYSAFVAIDNEGKKVEGTLVQRSCPVPTLSKEFFNGLQEVESFYDIGPAQLQFKVRACQIPRGMAAMNNLTECSRVSSFNKVRACQIPRGMAAMNNLTECSRVSSFNKVMACQIPRGMAAMNNLTECSRVSSFNGFYSVKRQAPQMFLVCNLDKAESAKPFVFVSTGDKMLDVIALQEIFGNWTMSDNLIRLLEVSKQALESSNIVKDIDVMCTLAVIAWLRKTCSQQHDEWQMIETKALSWLATQNLSTNVDDLLKQTAHTLWSG